MLYEALFTPFATPAQQDQFLAVRHALAAEADAPDTLLLGRLALPDGPVLDAVVLRPHTVAILNLEPRGGRLTLTEFAQQPWLLDGTPLLPAEAVNPYQAFLQQKAALAEFLRPYLSPEQANLNFIAGLLLFGQPVTFAPEVEAGMSSVPGSGSFHLLADPTRFTRRLGQLATPEIELTADDLAHLAQQLGALPPEAAAPATEPEKPVEEPEPSPYPETTGEYVRQKAAQLWRWLGAEDIEDVDRNAYEGAAPGQAQQEKTELEHLRTTLQAEVAQQLQAMEARELERERSIAQLREQLAQAPPVAPEATQLQQRLATETREKEALEQAIRASQAESAARNQELDAKIKRLEKLMQQQAATPGSTSGVARLSPGFRKLRAWRRRLPRVGLAAGVVAGLAFGIWSLTHLTADAPHPFQHQGLWGFADEDGDPVVPARYTSVGEFGDQKLAVVQKDGAYGFVDTKGREVLPPAYDALNPYADGYARARVGDLYTFVDEDGQEFPAYYYNALDFNEGRAAVLDQRGWFYITGPEEPSPTIPIFQEAYSFHKGVARVKIGGSYTFITPRYLTDPSQGTAPFGTYSQATDFVDGRARVTQHGKSFFIDADADPVEK